MDKRRRKATSLSSLLLFAHSFSSFPSLLFPSSSSSAFFVSFKDLFVRLFPYWYFLRLSDDRSFFFFFKQQSISLRLAKEYRTAQRKQISISMGILLEFAHSQPLLSSILVMALSFWLLYLWNRKQQPAPNPLHPPEVPGKIPFMGHAIAFGKDPRGEHRKTSFFHS